VIPEAFHPETTANTDHSWRTRDFVSYTTPKARKRFAISWYCPNTRESRVAARSQLLNRADFTRKIWLFMKGFQTE
jgi:hypothetical protein